jgi:aldehyde dehydrogenase (NAD+)
MSTPYESPEMPAGGDLRSRPDGPGYHIEDNAVSIANNSIYRVSGVVSSGDVDRAFGVAKPICTGKVTINRKSHFDISRPFGGAKQSGLGRP